MNKSMKAMNTTNNELYTAMQWIEGGCFLMGSDNYYPEERPTRMEDVPGFWIDITPVTNAQFAHFVHETGYVTLAERAPTAEDYPDADPDLLVPGSLVFRPAQPGEHPRHYTDWWFYVPGACWKCPDGVNSLTMEDNNKPVVQVCWEDAMAYALWVGKELPREVEWEYAARGGLHNQPYAWGSEFQPEGNIMANTWQGIFPFPGEVTHTHFYGTSPVGTFPANGYGLFDMIGNVWEWTSDEWQSNHQEQKRSCCMSSSHLVERKKVVKGGSHLCAPNYCQRYRPAARQAQTIDSATTHIGFRCIIRPQPE